MKTVLITGASSGIGKNIGEYLSSKKFKVYGTCRNPLNYPDTKFELVKANINIKKEIDECVNYILLKEHSIEILINNAGIGFTGSIEDSKINDVEKLFNTNFFGPIEMIKSVLPSMRNNKNGLIINMTSIAGYIGLPFRGIYCASKSALEILTESLRLELIDYNIKVTNIAPGDFKTNIVSRRIDSFDNKDSVYFEKYYKSWKEMNKHVDSSGSDPLIISKLVYKIINLKNPKIHYKAGTFFQKFSIILKRILPDLLFEKILIKYNKL
jgi:short-subunit dehydrogenase